MATGLQIPLGVNRSGRANLVSDDSQIIKIIALHMSISDSENPFQDIGLDGLIYDINDTRLQPVLKHKLVELFVSLKADEIAELDESSIKFIEEDGELILDFRFYNLSSNSPVDVRATVDKIGGRIVP
jgi:hypothetical protein